MKKHNGHLPVRTCVICRVRHTKNELIRLTLSHEGHLVRDDNGTMPGRGLYVCATADCVETLKKRNGVSGRAFRKDGFITLGPEFRFETEKPGINCLSKMN